MIKSIKYWGIASAFLINLTSAHAQNDQKPTADKLIQFSGLVLTSDSLMALPYVNIYIPGTTRGTVSDLNGFFSFVAHKGDTVTFSFLGFKTSKFVIPDTLKGFKYSLVKLMTSDTFYLDEAIIRPLPSREMFDYYFVKTEIPDDDLERARKNLDRDEMKEYRNQMGMDGRENSKYYLQQQANKFYYAGQIPPMNIFSPIAWAKFFEAWKRGDFKKTE
jgi:hypothetical protein